jgi:hypothetical protein
MSLESLKCGSGSGEKEPDASPSIFPEGPDNGVFLGLRVKSRFVFLHRKIVKRIEERKPTEKSRNA